MVGCFEHHLPTTFISVDRRQTLLRIELHYVVIRMLLYKRLP